MKKVCILTSVHPPFDTRIFHKQAKSLVKSGYDVTLIVQHDRNEVVDGVKIAALFYFKSPKNERVFGYLRDKKEMWGWGNLFCHKPQIAI